MSMPLRPQRIASLESDGASDIEREAILLVRRVNHRIQELRDQRTHAGSREPLPGSDEDGVADAPRAQSTPRQPDG